MKLSPELLKAIETGLEARNSRAKGKDMPMPRMHIAIAGPAKSGRTTLARDYSQELSVERLGPDSGVILSIKYLDGLPGERLDEIFRMARDSTLVIRDMTRAGPRTAELDERIEKALQQEGPPLIVLLGSEKYLKKLLHKIQPAEQPVPLIVMPHSFTPEEQAEFNNNKTERDKKWSEEREQRRQQREEKWQRQLKNVALDNPVTALPTIRIKKPPRP